MRRSFLSFAISAGLLLALVSVATTHAFPQTATGEAQTEVVMVNLSPPVYPPLARQARIMGDVNLQLHIRQDGSIESVDFLSGHPILRQAALDSAKKSQFKCSACIEGTTLYSVTYTFEISGECRFGPHCEELEHHEPQVTESPGQIRVVVGPVCLCDPAATIVRSRSAKCLYLWKCGYRGVAVE